MGSWYGLLARSLRSQEVASGSNPCSEHWSLWRGQLHCGGGSIRLGTVFTIAGINLNRPLHRILSDWFLPHELLQCNFWSHWGKIQAQRSCTFHRRKIDNFLTPFQDFVKLSGQRSGFLALGAALGPLMGTLPAIATSLGIPYLVFIVRG